MGFTLIELTIVLAVVAIVAALGTVISLEFYRSRILDSERDQLLSILRRARIAAMNNIYGLPHGVYFSSSTYTLFAGKSYGERDASKDEIFPRSPVVSFAGPPEIVFSPLAATSTASSTIVLGDGRTTTTLSVNYEGRISW